MWEKDNLLNREFIVSSVLLLQNWLDQERVNGLPSGGDPAEARVAGIAAAGLKTAHGEVLALCRRNSKALQLYVGSLHTLLKVASPALESWGAGC